MPIFSYFVGVGSVLVALLFVADAALEKRATPVVTTSSLYGLPKPWQPGPTTPTLAAAPAPAPDMSSAAVLAAMPKTASAPNTEPLNERRVTADAKKKRVAHKQQQQQQQQQWGDYRQSYAWSPPQRNPFGGGGLFGRF
jgi:type IV secretory pathway VirB10-like protein